MTVIDIEPEPCGGASFRLHGERHDFPSWEAAVANVRRRGATPNLLPFPTPSIDVLATAPALRVPA